MEKPTSKIIKQYEGKTLTSRCLLAIIPSDDEKHNKRPFAVIENVRTTKGYENKGYATKCLEEAIKEAKKADCYKIFLTTSSNKPNVHHLYKKLGFKEDIKICYQKNLD